MIRFDENYCSHAFDVVVGWILLKFDVDAVEPAVKCVTCSEGDGMENCIEFAEVRVCRLAFVFQRPN